MTEEAYRKLKRSVEEARASAEQAKGALSQIEEQLLAEYGCESVKEARAKLEEMEAKLEKAEAAYKKEADAYEKKWLAHD